VPTVGDRLQDSEEGRLNRIVGMFHFVPVARTESRNELNALINKKGPSPAVPAVRYPPPLSSSCAGSQ